VSASRKGQENRQNPRRRTSDKSREGIEQGWLAPDQKLPSGGKPPEQHGTARSIVAEMSRGAPRSPKAVSGYPGEPTRPWRRLVSYVMGLDYTMPVEE